MAFKPSLPFEIAKALKKNPSNIWKMKPRHRQDILRMMGYDVPLDGKSGPQTAAAAWAFTKGYTPAWVKRQHPNWAQQVWNTHFAHRNGDVTGNGNPGVNPGAGSGTDVSRPAAVKPNPQGPAGSGSGSVDVDPTADILASAAGSSDLQKQLAGIIKQYQAGLGSGASIKDVLDPSKFKSQLSKSGYASKLADTKYNAVLDNLKAQIGLAPKQTEQNIADIGDWFGQAEATQKHGATSNAAALASQLAGLQSSGQGFVSAVGGAADPASAGIANSALLAEAALRAQGNAQSNFDNSMAGIIDAQRAQEQLNASRSGGRTLRDLQNQLASAQAEKGSFQAATQAEAQQQDLGTYLDATKTRFDQLNDIAKNQQNGLLGLSNLIMGASQLPGQLTQQNLQNAGAAANLANQITLNAQEREKLKLFQDTYSGGHGAGFNALDHGTRAKLAAQLMTGLLGPKGYLTVNPKQFLNTVSNRLYNIAGYQRNDSTDQYVKSLLEPRLVNWWNKYHPKQPYYG